MDPGFNGFQIDLSQLPRVGSDLDGNVVDIEGRVIEGPLVGTQLEQVSSFMGYWFSLAAFYPDIQIYE